MKNLFIAVCISLFLAAPASADITGTTVAGGFACEAAVLDDDSQNLLNRWILLNIKRVTGDITEEETKGGVFLGSTLCAQVIGGIPATLIQTDGVDYLLEVLCDEEGCLTVIMKSDGFLRD